MTYIINYKTYQMTHYEVDYLLFQIIFSIYTNKKAFPERILSAGSATNI